MNQTQRRLIIKLVTERVNTAKAAYIRDLNKQLTEIRENQKAEPPAKVVALVARLDKAIAKVAELQKKANAAQDALRDIDRKLAAEGWVYNDTAWNNRPRGLFIKWNNQDEPRERLTGRYGNTPVPNSIDFRAWQPTLPEIRKLRDAAELRFIAIEEFVNETLPVRVEFDNESDASELLESLANEATKLLA
jgi:hypothetical protein